MTKKRIHLIYSIVLSIALAVTGILLIMACWDIYFSGERPFSPASVAAAFIAIRIPVYVTLALILCGFVLDLIFPLEKKKIPPEKQYGVILQRLHRKLALSSCSAQLQKAIHGQRLQRTLVYVLFYAVTVICSCVFLGYAVIPAHYDDLQINESMISAMRWFFPCLGVSFLFGIFAHYFGMNSIQKEIGLVRQGLAEGAAASVAPDMQRTPFPVAAVLRWSILAVGIGIFFYGLLFGGTVDVLTKAVNICTECVGLG